MADTSQGEGWWQASDQKWYPPETHPNYKPPPPDTLPDPPAQPARFGPADGQNMVDWTLETAGVPGAGPPQSQVQPRAPKSPLWKRKWVWVAAALFVAVGIASAVDDDEPEATTAGAEPTSEPAPTAIADGGEADPTPEPAATEAPPATLSPAEEDDIQWLAAQLNFKTAFFQNGTEATVRALADDLCSLVRNANGSRELFVAGVIVAVADSGADVEVDEDFFYDVGVATSLGDCSDDLAELS